MSEQSITKEGQLTAGGPIIRYTAEDGKRYIFGGAGNCCHGTPLTQTCGWCDIAGLLIEIRDHLRMLAPDGVAGIESGNLTQKR